MRKKKVQLGNLEKGSKLDFSSYFSLSLIFL